MLRYFDKSNAWLVIAMLYKLGAKKLWNRIWFWTAADPQFSTLRTLSWDSRSKTWICFFSSGIYKFSSASQIDMILCFLRIFYKIRSIEHKKKGTYTVDRQWCRSKRHLENTPRGLYSFLGVSPGEMPKVRPLRSWGSFPVT